MDVDVVDRVEPVARAERRERVGEREPRRGEPERLEHVERRVAQLGMRRDQLELDAHAGVRPQREHRLERRDATADDEHAGRSGFRPVRPAQTVGHR